MRCSWHVLASRTSIFFLAVTHLSNLVESLWIRIPSKTKNILSLNNLDIPLDCKKVPFIYWWVIFSTGDSVTDWFTNKNKLSFHPFFNEYIGRFTRWFYKSINQPWACIKKFFNKHSWHKLIKVTLILQKERGFCLITHGLTKILRFFIRRILETCGPEKSWI